MRPIAELVRVVNQAHGTSFRLVGKLEGGTRGAYEVIDRAGRRAVLKPSDNPAWVAQLRRVVPLVDRVRAAGYPTPRFLCVGATPDGRPYHVHEYVPGRPLEALTPAALDLVLAVVEQQADQDISRERSWSSYVRDVVFADGSGWASAMRGHSTAADLLDAVEALAAPYAEAPLPNADVVHGDFHADHVIVRDGRVAGVIDFEAAGCGTRAIDLAVMLGWDYDGLDPAGRARLLARIGEIAGRPGLAICLAYQVVNMAAYAILHRPAAAVPGALARGWALLGEVGAAM